MHENLYMHTMYIIPWDSEWTYSNATQHTHIKIKMWVIIEK